jgi:leucyl-tRNA synthetase
MQYNTVVSAVMKMLNTLEAAPALSEPPDCAALSECFSILLRVLYPACPHVSYQLWLELGYESQGQHLLDTAWPTVDESALIQDEIEMMLQVNGKLRGSVVVAANSSKEEIEKIAVASESFQRQAIGAAPKKVIVVPGRLVNIVI